MIINKNNNNGDDNNDNNRCIETSYDDDHDNKANEDNGEVSDDVIVMMKLMTITIKRIIVTVTVSSLTALIMSHRSRDTISKAAIKSEKSLIANGVSLRERIFFA